MEETGRFIVLDGPDGCGKSTQVERLAERLRASGREVDVVRDPGGTPIGEAVRGILLNPNFAEMSVRTEMLLYMASRAQLVKERIRPALSDGRIILSDRYVTSTIVYQGLAGGLDVGQINQLYEYACGKTSPNLVVVLDIPVEVSRARLGHELDRMENKSSAFHEKVRQGYLEFFKPCNLPLYQFGRLENLDDQIRQRYLLVAHSQPGTHVVIDASESQETVAETIWKAVEHVL